MIELYKSSYDYLLENIKMDLQENQILNEETTKDKMTFIGKNENMKKIEENFNSLIHLKNKENGAKIQSSKELKEIEHLCEKEFGFKMMNLYTGRMLPDLVNTAITLNGIYERDQDPKVKKALEIPEIATAIRAQDFINLASKQQYGAITYPTSSFIIRANIYDMPELLNHKEKFYDYSHKYVCCVYIPAEYFDGEKTGEEITAVLLHEIGHCFDVNLHFYLSELLGYFLIFINGKTLSEKLISIARNIVGVELATASTVIVPPCSTLI